MADQVPGFVEEDEHLREMWKDVMLVSVHLNTALSREALSHLRDSLLYRIKDLTAAPILVLEEGATIELITRQHVEIAKLILGALSANEIKAMIGLEVGS